ncbi:MAG: hypothetical protein QW794_03815 [Thermosphaera sp.]
MVRKSQVLAAAILAIIALSAIAYAHAIMGTVTLTTVEVVESIPSVTYTFPARSAGNKGLGDIVLNFSKGGFSAGDTVRVRVELAVDDPQIYEGFHSIVIRVRDGTTVKAILTLHTPYDEFTVSVPASLTKSLPVDLIYATGAKPVIGATFRLRVTIVGFE